LNAHLCAPSPASDSLRPDSWQALVLCAQSAHGSSPLVKALLLRDTVLSGRLHGAADQPKLQAAVSAVKSGVVLLDLGGTEFLSSSYFDAAIWPLWATVGEETYPMLGNVPDAAADDIEIVLKEQSAAIWSVTESRSTR